LWLGDNKGMKRRPKGNRLLITTTRKKKKVLIHIVSLTGGGGGTNCASCRESREKKNGEEKGKQSPTAAGGRWTRKTPTHHSVSVKGFSQLNELVGKEPTKGEKRGWGGAQTPISRESKKR